MGQLLIRALDDSTVASLERRAAQSHTSAEEEAQRLLSADAEFDMEAWQARLKAARDELGQLPGPDSTALLQDDRDRDNDR